MHQHLVFQLYFCITEIINNWRKNLFQLLQNKHLPQNNANIDSKSTLCENVSQVIYIDA
jgi:hypothetical protein